MEAWKDIDGYEGYYQVSNYGEVRSLDYIKEIKSPYGGYMNKRFKGRVLSPNDNGNGYLSVQLFKGKRKYIHRLVANAFLDNSNGYKEINHKDRNTKNNNVENLEWCTRKYNVNYKDARKRMSETRKRNKIKPWNKGIKHSKETKEKISIALLNFNKNKKMKNGK